MYNHLKQNKLGTFVDGPYEFIMNGEFGIQFAWNNEKQSWVYLERDLNNNVAEESEVTPQEVIEAITSLILGE